MMPTNYDDFTRFKASRRNAKEYPLNLVRTLEFQHSLSGWFDRLNEDEDIVFMKPPGSIYLWELQGKQNAFRLSPIIRTMEDLSTLLTEKTPDLPCRFIFIRTVNSRAPLGCTRDQLTLIFSHHQVPASFVEFILTFRKRETPHCFTSFCYENYLAPINSQTGLKALSRSGITINHSFNLLGLESHTSRARPWVQLQTAAFHSFDVVSGTSLWIVIKGNDAIRERVQRSTESALKRQPDSYGTVEKAFGESLRIHRLLFAWSAETLPAYIEFLEAELRDFSAITEYPPIKDLAINYAASKVTTRVNAVTDQPRSHTLDSNNTGSPISPVVKLFRRVTSSFSNRSRFTASANRNESISLQEHQVQKIKDLDLEELLSFSQLQSLSRLMGEVDSANTLIEQNMRVLEDIRDHYEMMVASSDFIAHISNIRLCQAFLSDFVQQVKRLERDLRNQQRRLHAILRRLQNIENLFNGILQYQAMQTGESFAKSAKESADTMEDWTMRMHRIAAKTEQETVSMHVITVFTLIFLPGTFVSTVFSSGILSFEDEDATTVHTSMGKRQVRLPARNLFFAICFPLMAVTLSAWLSAYWYARHGRKKSDHKDQLPVCDNSEEHV